MRKIVFLTALFLALVVPWVSVGSVSGDLLIEEFVISDEVMTNLRAEWLADIAAKHPAGSWAPLKFEPNDAQLAAMGLPSKEILLSRRYPEPTMVTKTGEFEPVTIPMGTLGPTVASFGGAGWFGIRPGAFLLLLNGGSIGWCSMAHVFGSAGNYDISTAGHCGKTGDVATVIAGFGNRAGALNPILLDFGTFGTSHDGGLGNDWSLINIDSQWQSLVSPTMIFWGGPRGTYTKTGSTVSVTIPTRIPRVPTISVNPDPLLAQTIVHYGHGTGIGTGGTPRAGEAIHWGASHYMFFGAISPGDSGSGANTLLGDTVGANLEAAGIMTHLYVDPLMRQGLGIMGGTRTTAVSGTLADGQLVSYPVPAPGLP